MRLIAGLATAAALLASASPAAALTITETFETLAPKDTPLPFLVSPVGTFTGQAGSPFQNVFIASPGYSNFGPGNNPTTSSVLVANGDESFDVTLAFASSTVSMDVYLNDLGPATVEFFNGASSLATFTFFADALSSNNFQTISLTHFVPITRFTFNSTNGGQLNTGLDNVTITAVPEPAAWALMIGGFALAGLGLRRQAKRAIV
jgi:hypothetical protein